MFLFRYYLKNNAKVQLKYEKKEGQENEFNLSIKCIILSIKTTKVGIFLLYEHDSNLNYFKKPKIVFNNSSCSKGLESTAFIPAFR